MAYALSPEISHQTPHLPHPPKFRVKNKKQQKNFSPLSNLSPISINETKNIVNNNTINILCTNIQSINRHYNDLNQLVTDIEYPEIISLNEIWNPYINITIPHYKIPIIKTRQNKRGGGVATYIRKDIQHAHKPDLETNFIETTTTELTLKTGKKILHSSIYIPPATKADKIKTGLTDLITKLSDTNIPFFITGDTNINTLKDNRQSSILNNILQNFNCSQNINCPTRITGNTSTLIDHVITNYPNTTNSYVISASISDHLPTITSIIPTTKRNPKSTIKITQHEKINKVIQSTNWQETENDITNKPTNESAKILSLRLQSIIDNLTITKHADLFTKPKKPWISYEILTAKNNVNKLRNKLLKKPTPNNEQAYKAMKKEYNRMLKKSKYNYFTEHLKLNANNPKKTWQLINLALNKGHKTTANSEILINNQICSNQLTIANTFNNFFKNAAINITNKIPKPHNTYEHYLNKTPQVHDSFNFKPVTPLEILKSINNFTNKSSSGFDMISPKILKNNAVKLTPAITILINKILTSGNFPEYLKTSKITPLFKKGLETDINNYRPISQLPILSKIAEKIMIDQMLQHLNNHKVITKYQFGFRKLHSTDHAVISTINHIETQKNLGNYTILLSLDLSRAFDTVESTTILPSKLTHYGFSPKATETLKNFFLNRKQFVTNNNHKSNTEQCHDISVVQGSTLGPQLFQLYINDLPNITKLQCYLFADDTNILISGPNLETITHELNNELLTIQDYFNANKLSLNTSKSNFMIVPPKPNSSPTTTIEINNQIVQQANSIKFLGIEIDNKLNFQKHVKTILPKLNKGLHALITIKNTLTYKSKLTIFNSLIQSHLQYGAAIWIPKLNTKTTNQLTKIQKRAIRLVFNVKYNHHTAILFKLSSTLTIDKLGTHNCINLAGKHMHNKLPDIFQEIIKIDPNSRNPLKFPQNCKKSDTIYNILNAWTKYKDKIDTTTINSIKNSCKRVLINEYDSDIQKCVKKCKQCLLYNEEKTARYMMS